MKKVRLGIIGVGVMGQEHARQSGKIKEVELTAVADVNAKTAVDVGEKYNVPFFADHRQLINSGLVDAVVVAAPHNFHVPISCYALKKGIHVLVEKPLAVTVGEADKLIRAAKKSRRIFGVMLQQRLTPHYQAAKKIIAGGGVGKIYRVSMVIPWWRAQAYYDSGDWRATWKGEGGGIIINQFPHNLDMLCWLVGMPQRVYGWVKTRYHRIEVEDEAYAVLEYASGSSAYIYSSTFETPGVDRMEICGEKGKLLIEGGKVRYWKLSQTLPKGIKNSVSKWSAPASREMKIRTSKSNPGHSGVTRNFARAILKKEKLLISGEEGIRGLELGNAILLSGKKGVPVKLPLNRGEVERLLERLRRKSSTKSRARKSKAGERAPYLK
jgi:predicted dehydrogenase